jgi:rfaE bifunctional protein nucleotidyltransferase chain/domain
VVKLVLTNGCFDILHAGHVDLLQRAARLGDNLLVMVNSDISVMRLKGTSRPINCLKHRMAVLKALRCVDMVESFDGHTVAAALRRWRPAVWVKGGDYTMETLNPDEVAAARKVGAEIVILPFGEEYKHLSTTSILAKI